MSMKDTNPKDAVGVRKWRQYCTVPTTVIWELGVAMLEGARKYGRHNYRVAGVRASVYLDAAKGHLDCFWEGEDLDPDSGLSHITKAMASLAVLRDAMVNEMWTDDRPPKVKDFDEFKAGLGRVVDEIMDRHPDAREPFTELGERLKAAGLPTVTPAEIATRLAEEKSRAALRAKRDLERGDEVWVDSEAIDAPEPPLGGFAHAIEGPWNFHTSGPEHRSIKLWHPDSIEFDQVHVFEGLTTKQFCRLVAAEAEPGKICGMNFASKSGNYTISHPAIFDALAGAIIDRTRTQTPRDVALTWENAHAERRSRLTDEQWRIAIPSLTSIHEKPYHGVMKP